MGRLDDIIKTINKKEQLISIGVEKSEIKTVPFSSYRLNYCTYGGIPMGRLVEFFGEEGGGKTTTALDVAAGFQQTFPDKRVMFVDVENTLDLEWAELMGLDITEAVIMKPQELSAEEIFQIVIDCIESGEISLVVIDSLAAMMSKHEFDKSIEEKTYAGISMALTVFSRKAVDMCKQHNTTVIGINQLRDNLANPHIIHTPGGKAWKFLCSLRIMFRKGSFIDESGRDVTRGVENPAGNLVDFSIIKSKCFRSDRRTGFYTLRYLEGIDTLIDFIDVACRFNIIQPAGAWYQLPDLEKKLNGKQQVKTYLQENDDVYQKLKKQVDELIKG